MADLDSTQQIELEQKPEERLRRRDDLRQAEFKRRCAYYAMMMLGLIVFRSFIAETDIQTRWADIINTSVWSFAGIIIGAMGVEGWQAWAASKRQ
mgnify:CR=1 FL=1